MVKNIIAAGICLFCMNMLFNKARVNKLEQRVIETNDFKYYMHLKRLKVSTKFTGKTSDLVKLKNDILTYLNK